MNIPMVGVDEGAVTPWTFQMCFDEQAQLAEKVSGLLAPSNATVAALAVDVEGQAVNVTVFVDEVEQEPISVPQWRRTSSLSAYPANYVAERIKGFLGL